MHAAGAEAAAATRQTARPVSLVPVSAANYNAVIKLAVAPAQADFVASNAVTLAQAAYEPESWLRAIYAGSEPVGVGSSSSSSWRQHQLPAAACRSPARAGALQLLRTSAAA